MWTLMWPFFEKNIANLIAKLQSVAHWAVAVKLPPPTNLFWAKDIALRIDPGVKWTGDFVRTE